MSLRHVLIAVVMMCGLCVWGFARPGAEPASTHVAAEVDCNNHDEAAARYRTNQSRHWRQLAIGSSTTH